MGLVWFDLVEYKVLTFYYVWNWSKSLVWWVGGGGSGVVFFYYNTTLVRFFIERFFEIFISNLGLVWFDSLVYQISTFYYVCNWSKSLVWCVALKATLVFIFGPRLGI